MLVEADLLPKSTHELWKMAKGIVLYVSVNKPGYWPKGWRGKVVRVLHCKEGEATNGAKKLCC